MWRWPRNQMLEPRAPGPGLRAVPHWVAALRRSGSVRPRPLAGPVPVLFGEDEGALALAASALGLRAAPLPRALAELASGLPPRLALDDGPALVVPAPALPRLRRVLPRLRRAPGVRALHVVRPPAWGPFDLEALDEVVWTRADLLKGELRELRVDAPDEEVLDGWIDAPRGWRRSLREGVEGRGGAAGVAPLPLPHLLWRP